MPRPIKRLLPVALMALLSGCISLAPKPPAQLLTLDAAAAPAAGVSVNSENAKTITVLVPSVPAAIAGARIPVNAGPTSIAYVKGALWSEPPARLFARLIADTVSARTGRVVLSNAQSFADPGARLNGELRRFGIDAGTSEAIVVFDATLMRDGQKTFEKRRFEARAPVSKIDAISAAAALNVAANRAAADIADWVGR